MLLLLLNYYHYVVAVCLFGGRVGGGVVRLGERGKQKMNLFRSISITIQLPSIFLIYFFKDIIRNVVNKVKL